MAWLLSAGCVVTAACATQDVSARQEHAGGDAVATCGAMPYHVLETQADAPVSIVRGSYVEDAPVSDADNRQYRRRSHSQGAPVDPLEILPTHCKLEGYIAPHVRFEMFLPVANAWNGKFLLAACDGFCGNMASDPGIPGLVRGYATMSSDGGHTGRPPFDAIWAYNNRQAEIDFGYRANHVLVQTANAILSDYYGREADYAYMTGFSKGGLAGVMSAQRYPDDFDGILARGPVLDYQGRNVFGSPWVANATYDENDQPIILSSRIDLIHNAVVAACDAYDGLEDNLISDPRLCDFEPATLLCAPGTDGADVETCLTAPEVDALVAIYSPPLDSNGEPLYPVGMEYGSEHNWGGFILPNDADHPSYSLQGARHYLKYLAFDEDPGPDYDWRTFDPETVGDALDVMAEIYDADSPDLTGLEASGNKLIIMHGWADGAIAARATVLWYDEMLAFMGGPERTEPFVRLFVAPGVHHGSRGPGPNIYDALTALESWVERGDAPDEIVFYNEEVGVVTRSRPVYPFPVTAQWDGVGDVNDAASFAPNDPRR